MSSPYTQVMLILADLEKQDKLVRVMEYLESIRQEMKLALALENKAGNIVSSMKLQANLDTVERVQNYIKAI